MVQLQVKFITKQEKYKCSETTYTLPGASNVDELNQVLKQVLINEKKIDESSPVKFDFLIEDEFLRSSVLDHLNEKNLSRENVLNVEYFEKQNAPKLQKSFQLNDWVACVKLCEGLLLIGSFDQSVSVWSEKKQDFLFQQPSAHDESIHSVEWISITDKKIQFATSGYDEDIILYEADLNGDKIKPVICCKGHSNCVTCISANKNNNLMATCSYDKTVKIWSSQVAVREEDKNVQDPELQSRKKRQKSDIKGFPRSVKITLNGHKENVMGVTWMNNSEVVSCSWDHTVKVWDLNQEMTKTDLRTSLALNCLDYSSLNGLIATGCCDRHIRLFDHRVNDGKVVKTTLTSHHNWVKAIKWSPDNQHQLVSGGFDDYVKTWDIRSTKTALFDVKAHSDNVLTLDWTGNQIVSGGKDNKAFMFSASDGQSQRQII